MRDVSFAVPVLRVDGVVSDRCMVDKHWQLQCAVSEVGLYQSVVLAASGRRLYEVT
jgi:hypothetical protein